MDSRSGLCFRHHSLIEVHRAEQEDSENVYVPLIRNSQGLQTAQGINHTLSNLYELLAKNRISTRRAATLAYINSLLLRTLPAIDADNKAGISDPTAPPKLELTDTDEASEDTAENTINAIMESGLKNKAKNSAVEVREPSGDSENSKTSWDPLLPQPDPTKKPS